MKETDLSPVFALVGELEARFEANLQVARSALAAATADPFVAGSRGQLRAHPGFAVAKAADEVVLRLAVELRLCRRQVPEETQTAFDELDGKLHDLAARRRSRNGEHSTPPTDMR